MKIGEVVFMKKGQISTSMMCSKLECLNLTLKLFEEEHIDYLHIDVMDGEFVPNLGLGVDYIRGLRKMCSIPLDLHLMINKPELKLSWFELHEKDIVSIHYESTNQIKVALDFLKSYKCKRFIAISPQTDISVVEDILDDIDGINVLFVNPGFAGQNLVPNAIERFIKLKKLLLSKNREDILLQVDGNITFSRANELHKLGANIFVAGSSSIFTKEEEYKKNILKFRKEIQ